MVPNVIAIDPPINDNEPELADYRPNVGVTLFNAKGQVFLGKRVRTRGPYNWQLPQGGIDQGEDALTAAFRELHEETGIRRQHAEFLGAINRWLPYDFPAELRGRRRPDQARAWAGQKQRWFALRFTGTEADINLAADAVQEFDDWRWEALDRVPGLVIPWKRPVYTTMVSEFMMFAVPV
jgi:putative (di)nucleoside polyphosphate hydrolase